jgi:glycosyltransferase involved in cell wall biosynthesis
MYSPLVNVLIRSAGRPTLNEALRSAIEQTHPQVAIWVLDVSGHQQVKIPAEFVSRVQLITSEMPLSRSAAANRLLREATGQWALFLDDDDWLAPDHIAGLYQALTANDQLMCAYSSVSAVVAADDKTQPWREIKRFENDFDPLHLLIENYIPIHAALFRLDRVKAAGLRFDEAFDLFEDWDFWLACAELGTFAHHPQTTAYYRIHGAAGMGVQLVDPVQGERALGQLLAKWRQRWTPQQLSDLVGLLRHVYALQANEALLLQEAHDNRSRYERALQEAEDERLRLVREGAQMQTALREAEARVVALENSRSWRITRPLRVAADVLRSLLSALVLRGRPSSASWPQRVLDWATAFYLSDMFRPFVRLVPFQAKRAVRNTLMRWAHQDRVRDVPSDQNAPTPGGGRRGWVTIVIPVYNHADYLAECIASALGQSWTQTEVVVVDDASTDPRVAQILASFVAHPRIKLLRHTQNQGICHAQNTALVASTGEVVAFLDCDDRLAPEAIEVCMRAWRPDTVYLHTGRVNMDETGREINRIHFESLPREDYFQENLRAMFATHLKLIRRDAFAKVGLFDPRFDSAQDYEMLMRIAFHYPSRTFVHVPDFLYFHRIHGQQTTETQRARQDRLTRVIQDEARQRERIRNGQYDRKISFIMLSYGKHSQTLKAIEGLKATVKIPHEIILYDNGSAVETVQFLRTHVDGRFEDVKVFYGEKNLGPAQGRRVALEQASGEWFIVFDNDEVPEPGWIEELLLRAEAHSDVGAVCCRVVFPDGKLQFSGGRVDTKDPADIVIDLALFDRGLAWNELASCVFREVDWCPIGATLFTENIAPYLHDGYPNTFEDAGVSFALKKKGRRLLNAPGALVWHDHITFQPKAEMSGQYMKDRYNPRLMLKSIHSFLSENGLLIHDEYIWRENGLDRLTREQLIQRLDEAGAQATVF